MDTRRKKQKFAVDEKSSDSPSSSSTALFIYKSHELSTFQTVATEVFIEICSHLPPKDLITLSQVCRLFHTYLSSDQSSSTNLIWKRTREIYLPFYTVPPPVHMNERQYIRFITDKSCQLCGKRYNAGRGPHIFFEYWVRCCGHCMAGNLIQGDHLLYRNFSKDLLTCAPYCLPESDKPRYWHPMITRLEKEYMALPEREQDRWLADRYYESRTTIRDARKRYENKKNEENDRIRQSNLRRKKRLEEFRRRIEEMMNETRSDGSHIWEVSVIRRHCVTYLNTIRSNSTQPLTDRSWKILRGKIEREYFEYEEERRIRLIAFATERPSLTFLRNLVTGFDGQIIWKRFPDSTMHTTRKTDLCRHF